VDTRLVETMSLVRGLVLIGQKYNLDEYAFNPYRARVRAGTQIAFVNNGKENHTIQAQDASWTTGRLIPGDMTYLTFDKPGRHTYICKEHPWSYGQIIVTEPESQDGLYTREQAARGRAAYVQSCASCHGDDLSGRDPSPALSGNAFMTRWGARSIAELFDKTRTTMPTDRPSGLSEQMYLDILAYVLQTNQLPPGRSDLRNDPATLRRTVGGR
jgi:plastocyanin